MLARSRGDPAGVNSSGPDHLHCSGLHKDANTVPQDGAWLGAACIGPALLALGLSLTIGDIKGCAVNRTAVMRPWPLTQNARYAPPGLAQP